MASADPWDDPLEPLYDEGELRRIDHAAAPVTALESARPEAAPGLGRGAVRPTASMRRFGVSGMMLAGAMAGVAQVLEPERAKQHVIEFAPDALDEATQPVTFHMVPGSPRASRIIIRPWLADRLRR